MFCDVHAQNRLRTFPKPKLELYSFWEEYLVLRSKRGILETARNPELYTSERRLSKAREEMGLHPN
jgi:hypothetical protein